jgi:hypothetical protein
VAEYVYALLIAVAAIVGRGAAAVPFSAVFALAAPPPTPGGPAPASLAPAVRAPSPPTAAAVHDRAGTEHPAAPAWVSAEDIAAIPNRQDDDEPGTGENVRPGHTGAKQTLRLSPGDKRCLPWLDLSIPDAATDHGH